MAFQDGSQASSGRAAAGDCAPSRARPVDLVHLARQTMGDRTIEQEVLRLFVHQLAAARARFGSLAGAERRALAHTLKGSARGVGAFALADCAAAIEDDPCDPDLADRFAALADEAAAFIATINH